MNRLLCLGIVLFALGGVWPGASTAQGPSQPVTAPQEVCWYTDYTEAMNAADRQGKMLLLFFYAPQNLRAERFEAESLGDAAVRRQLRQYVCARVPLDCKIRVQGKELVVLQHEAFREMLGRPGIAIVDLTDPKGRLYGTVVSMFPLTEKLWYTHQQVGSMLELPPGTLTQRTLIYAVRTHPERPASTEGQLNPHLSAEAECHADYQARIRLQGHHFWERRFYRINARLPAGCSAREVCAESWPGENLVEAAIECVRCWRLSSGHWSAVRARHFFFGYDMKRGANGVWYATGIFGGHPGA